VNSGILVAIRVATTPERAFDVFTREIGAWWRPNDLFRFTPKGSGRVAFEGGAGGRLIETLPNGEVFEIGRIVAWEPGVRLAFGWRQASFTADQEHRRRALRGGRRRDARDRRTPRLGYRAAGARCAPRLPGADLPPPSRRMVAGAPRIVQGRSGKGLKRRLPSGV
jgi:hypothetical protein